MTSAPHRWAIGIDLGGSSLKGGLVGEDGRMQEFRRTLLDGSARRDVILEALDSEIRRLKESASARGIVPVGIGVASPGSIERARGIIHKSPNLPGMQGLDLRDRLTRLSSLEVMLVNDANAAVLGELKFGAGADYSDLVMLTLGTGIGGGIVIGGRLYDGSAGFAGEIGHMIVDPNGPECPCGSRGCLERLVGAPALLSRASILLQESGGEGPLAGLSPGDLTVEAIGDAARAGDPVGRQVLEEMGHWLGLAFISIINILDPDCVLVGGGIAQAGPPLFDVIRRTVDKHPMSATARVVPIVTATLGPRAGAAGAGALALWPDLG